MGMFDRFINGVQDIQHSGAGAGDPAGPVPGKKTLTSGIPPRSNGATLSKQSQDFIDHGDDFNPADSLWDDSPESQKKRERLREVIALQMPLYFADLDAAIERVILDLALSTAPPPSMALLIIGFACDVISSGIVSRVSAATKALGTAARVAKGVSEATDQAVPVLASMILKVSPKHIETATKSISSIAKKRVEERVKKVASQDFNAEKADNKAFLKKVQNGFRDVARDFTAIYLGGTDMEKWALAVMLENRPSLEDLEQQFRDLLERYASQEIGHIGKKEGVTEAEYKAVCITAYGQKLYLNVVTAEGPRVGAPLRMTGAGGRDKDYIEPDRAARLVAIISPDLVSTAIANNGGKVEEVSMTWEAYRDGQSPVPTLNMLDGADWPPNVQGRFRAWILGAYQKAHGGNSPPDDAFSWSDPNGVDAHPAAPKPSAVPDQSGVSDAAVDAVSSAFDFTGL